MSASRTSPFTGMDLAGKTILITGGTGSFGRAIIPALLARDVASVRIFSRDEEKQVSLQRDITDPRVTFYVGDVRDSARVGEVVAGADVVYHAAALKVIGTGETDPLEVVKTNILGTENVRAACLAKKVEAAVLVSTDKAVTPVNLYGMTKGVAERVWIARRCQEKNPGMYATDTYTKFSVVRYGNVIGSRGSVIPLYAHLIRENKPLPLTDDRMTRFLITLTQAIDLVFLATGSNGIIFVPRIPAAKMVDIIAAMVPPGYPVTVTGIRPGEKIHECLVSEYEVRRSYVYSDIVVIFSSPSHPKDRLNFPDEYTSDAAPLLTGDALVSLLEGEGFPTVRTTAHAWTAYTNAAKESPYDIS